MAAAASASTAAAPSAAAAVLSTHGAPGAAVGSASRLRVERSAARHECQNGSPPSTGQPAAGVPARQHAPSKPQYAEHSPARWPQVSQQLAPMFIT
eukprot:scaffold2788_cov137-Isochrysis_galbana.AAC.1